MQTQGRPNKTHLWWPTGHRLQPLSWDGWGTCTLTSVPNPGGGSPGTDPTQLTCACVTDISLHLQGRPPADRGFPASPHLPWNSVPAVCNLDYYDYSGFKHSTRCPMGTS